MEACRANAACIEGVPFMAAGTGPKIVRGWLPFAQGTSNLRTGGTKISGIGDFRPFQEDTHIPAIPSITFYLFDSRNSDSAIAEKLHRFT